MKRELLMLMLIMAVLGALCALNPSPACSPVAGAQIYRQIDWDSTTELQRFLAQDTTDQYPWEYETFDCDDFALRLRLNALAMDKYISVVWIGHGEFQRLFGQPLDPQYDGHIMNAAIVGNWLYYIEPQTDQIFPGIMLDRMEK